MATLTRSSRLESLLRRSAAAVEKALARELASRRGAIPAPLLEGMRYSLLAPAKRVRPTLVFALCEAAGGTRADALPAAMAIECVHTYSLIHDDLPCMDDDDMRRGRPSHHVAFGEAAAVLAGDALLTLAFELLACGPRGRALAAVLAPLAGAAGMVGGQVLDLGTKPRTTAEVERVHLYKTAALFEASTRMGAISAGAPTRFVEAAGRFGRHLGLAFQAADDLLDAREGRTDGVNYAQRFGEERARRRAEEHARNALRALPAKGRTRAAIENLVKFVVEREH